MQDRFLAYDEFVEAANTALRSDSARSSVALLIADVDHFQQLAAVHGEASAEAILRSVLELVRCVLRQGDLASHPGGDELLVLLHAPAAEAGVVADRLCAAIRGHTFPIGEDGATARVTVSVGVAASPVNGDTFAALHAAADAARVRLKMRGRDGVAVAAAPDEEMPARPLDVDRFAGRLEERKLLERRLDEAVNGRPGVVVVLGERGSGAALLVRQLEPEARLRGGSLIRGRCRPPAAAEPYDVWRSILAALLRLPDPPAGTWHELPQLVPELASGAALAAPGTGSKYRLLEELAEFIRRSTASQPLVLLLDGMQWADDASWDALEHIVQGLDGERLLVCLTILADPSVPGVAERRQALARSELFHEMRLPRLTRDEVKRWVEAALHHQEVGRELLAFLYRHTEGNPHFISELLRALAEEGALWHGGERWEWSPVSELRFPEGLEALISRRLARFSDSTRAVLSTAAVIGREFDVSTLAAAGAGSEAAVQLALSEALAVRLLRSTYERGGGGYAFAHELVVEVLADSVPQDRIGPLHARVAAALERRRVERPVEIAMRYDRAGECVAAYRYALVAATRAEGVYALPAARQALLVAARNATSPGELAEVRVRLAQLADASGRFDEAEELCDLAIEWFDGQGDSRRALMLRRMRERARKELGQPARVTLDALIALDEEATELGFEQERVLILMMLSQTYGRLGDPAAAERIAGECVKMAEAMGDDALLGETLTRHGITVEWEDPDRAREIYHRALELFERAGDARGQTRCHNNLGNLALHRSAWDEARHSYTTAIALARTAGMLDFWGTAASNLGVISHHGGDYDRARELFGEALGLFAAVKNSELQLYALYNLAHIEWESGAWESGAELYEATASLAQRIGAADVELGSVAGEGLCFLELGRVDAARAAHAKIEARSHDSTGWFQGREIAEALAVRLLQIDGHLAEALQRFEAAVPMAEALDMYSAAWLTAVCARSLTVSAHVHVQRWIERYASRVEALGYLGISKQFKELQLG